MWNWKLLAGIALCCSVVAASDQLAEKWQKRINDIEATHAAAITKADNARFFATQKANGDRLNAFKKALADANKTTDVHAINALRDKVLAAEKDGAAKPKPKNIVKFGGHEYAFVEPGTSWYAAKSICEQMGGHLITIESPAELTMLDQLCKGKHIVWLGASDHEKEDVYVWLSGSPVDTTSAMLDRDSNGMADVLCYDAGIHKVVDWYSGGRLHYVCEWDN
jgi:hypothetical protein